MTLGISRKTHPHPNEPDLEMDVYNAPIVMLTIITESMGKVPAAICLTLGSRENSVGSQKRPK